MYDVIIAGAGVVGAFIARELSQYELKVCILEKENDVASGSSKANSGIVHAGYDCTPGSLKAMLNVRGSLMMEGIAEELDVPYKRVGSLVLGFGEKDKAALEELVKKGLANGVKDLEIIEGDRIKELEPLVSDEATHALYAPSAAIVCPYELTVAAIENAVVNGAELRRNCEVTAVAYKNDCVTIEAGGEVLSCRYLVNAAGIYSAKIAKMAGDNSFEIRPRKGEYMLMDKAVGNLVNRIIFQCPTAMGKGILVTPTVDGNIMAGPDARDIDDYEDTATSATSLEGVLTGAKKAVPGLELNRVITSFAGLRSKLAEDGADFRAGMHLKSEPGVYPHGDFIIEPSRVNPHFINVAGIESPGLTCAPAIGVYVKDMLGRQGLELNPRKDFKRYRDKVIRFRELNGNVLDELLKKDPSYGRLVCRCEKVTEGEVVDCIRRPAGALDLDSVKRRTRAGMGRCQGGFCTPRLIELLSRELGISCGEVTKKGGASRLLSDRTK